MEPAVAVDIGREAIVVTLIISGPVLVVGLVVGLAIGIFQAVTQIHEMTLTFIPKIIAMVAVLLLMLPWMIIQLIDYTMRLMDLIPQLTR